MVKIAIIDDILMGNHLIKDLNIASYTEVYIQEFLSSKEAHLAMDEKRIPFSIHSSHGTKVVNTIKKYSGEADIQIHYYNIFDRNNRSSGALLLETINKILEQDMDFVVISLSCPPKYHSNFMKLKSKIIDSGTIFIAASDNYQINTIPACLEFIYGVGMNNSLELGAYSYQKKGELNFYCNTNPEFIGRLDDIDIFGGTSKGTAIIAGRLISMMDQYGKEYLLDYLKSNRNEDEYFENPAHIKYERKEILDKLMDSFHYDFNNCPFLNKEIAWNKRNIDKFMKFLYKINRPQDIYTLEYGMFKSIQKIADHYSS